MTRVLFGSANTLLAFAITMPGCGKKDAVPGPAELGLEGPRPGQVAAELAGPDLDGGAMKLSDYRGKVVMLSFWAHT